MIVIVLLVMAPLAIWAATSGGSGDSDKEELIVERGASTTGAPELILSIAGDVKVTSGTSSVTIECVDKPGYPYPHVHQADSPEKVEGARRCRVLGTDTSLESEVQ